MLVKADFSSMVLMVCLKARVDWERQTLREVLTLVPILFLTTLVLSE